jgi:hypothetical protein
MPGVRSALDTRPAACQDDRMGKGYAEGPAAEEAERRREELAEPIGETPAARLAVLGCTEANPERHLLGWVGEVDPDALFASGAAWGIQVVRRPTS